VRCIECQTEPLTPGHYCECCGHKLSPQERKAFNTHSASPVTTAVANVSRVEEVPSTPSWAGSSARASSPDPIVSSAPHHGWSTASDTAETARREAIKIEAASPETVKPAAATTEPLKTEALRTEAGNTDAIKTPGADADSAHSRTETLSPGTFATYFNATPLPASRLMGLAAVAALAVAAIGMPLGAWVGIWRSSQPHSDERSQHAAPIQKAPAADHHATPLSVVPTPAEPSSRERTVSIPPKREIVASVQPRATVSTSLPPVTVRPSAPAKTVRQVDQPARQAATVPAPAPAVEAPAPVAAPPVVEPEAAAEPPRPAAPAPPAGRIFETFDVDESPRVATRIEPQFPGDLPERPVNDVVVVRVLVSQAGHPYSVAVLRRSRAGRALDDAVVAAVTRWTFSPAQKRGEAVSCWLNIGVAVGR